MAMLVRKKSVEGYMGMVEYKIEDEMHIIRSLIYDLKPKVAVALPPGLPAYIIFMCLRHADLLGDCRKADSLLANIIIAIKHVVSNHPDDLEINVMWLANTLRLLHLLNQYSGEKDYQMENTPEQNGQCLRRLDFSKPCKILDEVAVWIYEKAIKLMSEETLPLVVPSVLEHVTIFGLPGPSGDSLMIELTNILQMLQAHGVDSNIIRQVFRQMFYFISSEAFNNLLLKGILCHRRSGMQIRQNVSHLEHWWKDNIQEDIRVLEALQPIVQATELIQSRKTDDDVQSLCYMCNKLSALQIMKLLTLHTPDNPFEKVPESFLKKIQAQLYDDRHDIPGQSRLFMDKTFIFPVVLKYNPSKIRLEDIEIPHCDLNLPPTLKKL